jgi:hypothetical protein
MGTPGFDFFLVFKLMGYITEFINNDNTIYTLRMRVNDSFSPSGASPAYLSM